MPDILAGLSPRYMLKIAIIDGDVYEWPYSTWEKAKHDLELVFHGQPANGLWVDGKFFPVHRVEWAEIAVVEIVEKEEEDGGAEESILGRDAEHSEADGD